jgi:hypothetical protein
LAGLADAEDRRPDDAAIAPKLILVIKLSLISKLSLPKVSMSS